MTEKTNSPKKIAIYKLNPNQIGYKGPLIVKELKEGKISLIKEDLQTFYTPSMVVTHEGDSDFSLFFGHFDTIYEEFIADLIVIFSYGEILTFLNSLKKIKEDINLKIQISKPELPMAAKNDEHEIKTSGLVIAPTTCFFAPNAFNIFVIQDLEIFFGRRLGMAKEGKYSSLFVFSLKIPLSQLEPIISAIELNISKFEEKNQVKLEDLVLVKPKNQMDTSPDNLAKAEEEMP